MSVPPTTGAGLTETETTAARSRFVHDGFVASAPWYDALTRVFSFGLDARWRRAGLERCALLPAQRVLDVATGTGELVIAARRALGAGGIVVGLDFCGAMLEEARRKLALVNEGPVAWVQGRAEALPFALGVPVAAGVLHPIFGLLLSPMIASAATSLISVSVIGNALRLRRLAL